MLQLVLLASCFVPPRVTIRSPWAFFSTGWPDPCHTWCAAVSWPSWSCSTGLTPLCQCLSCMGDQYSKRGLSCAKWRGKITSPGLQASLLLMKPSMPSVSSVQGHTTSLCSTFCVPGTLSFCKAAFYLGNTQPVLLCGVISSQIWWQVRQGSGLTNKGDSPTVPNQGEQRGSREANQAEVTIQWSPNRFLVVTQIQGE